MPIHINHNNYNLLINQGKGIILVQMKEKTLHFQIIGDGKPVIILHGLFGSGDNWKQIAKLLSSQYKCFLFDLPNHGQSFWLDTFNYNSLAQSVKQTIDNLNLTEPVSIIGHSMGGKVAMQLVNNYPNLFQKLVVVDIAPKQYPEGHNHIFEALLDLNTSLINQLSDAVDCINSKLNDIALSHFLVKSLKRNKINHNYSWQFNLQALIQNYQNILATPILDSQINTNSLFIYGNQSDYILQSDLQSIETIFSHVKFNCLENAGHWLHAQYPKKFSEFTTQFLA